MSRKNKILLVDDDSMIRWTLTEALGEWGYAVTEAASGTSAREALQDAWPDIVLLDINLPDSSGLALLEFIKQQQPETFVIMMTGEVVVENTMAALRGGADDFVGKPIRLEELRFTLKQAEQGNRPSLSPKPRLLIVTDSHPQADQLLVSLGINNLDLTIVTTPEELQHASEEEHDVILVDVEAVELPGILATLRASPAHAECPILVEISRVTSEPSLAGVMPKYRAMPCTPTELIALTRRRIAALSATTGSYDFADAGQRL